MLPHLKDRPLSLKRYPNGIKGEYFFQKNTPASFPAWLRRVPIDHEETKGPINYVFADDRASLLYLANLGCIDQNPWMSRVESLDHPDFVLIDLDPQECPFDLIVEAALLVKQRLDEIGLTGYPKTTGGDGMHVYVPLEPVYSFEDSRTFAELLARLVIHERPDLFTTPRSVAQPAEGPRVLRLSAERQNQDHRRALRAARLPGRPGRDTAGVARGEGGAAALAVHHPQRARALRPRGRPVRRRFGETAAPGAGARKTGERKRLIRGTLGVVRLLFACLLLVLPAPHAGAADGFRPLFNGRNLDGWDGDPRLWKVRDGLITGSTEGVTLNDNSFLITRRSFRDFHLRVEMKLRNHNSGIQFRSEALPGWVVRGYQADAAANPDNYWGNLYDEKGTRGIMVDTWKEKGSKVYKPGDWNVYEIVCRGDHIQILLNGTVTADLHDAARPEGVIALQLHRGPPMQVQFRKIEIREFE